VVRAGQSLAEAFRTLQASVRESIRETEERIHDYASRASELAGRLAQLNAETRTSGDPTLLDRRDQVAEELAALTGGQVLDGDHGYRFMLEDGTVLVDGTRAARLEAVPDPAYANQSRIDVVDGASRLDVTGSIGGRMSGQIELRDRIAPQLGAEVDRLAFDLTSEVNAIHAAHAGLDGTAGRSFFAPSGSVTGAAASMAVDPSLLQDPGNLGAADPGVGPGSNAGLRSLADLADRFSSSAIDTMSSLGAEVASAIEGEAFASARFDALASLRDSLSGVSIEEEMMRLSEFQRAAEASLQFVATVDTLLEEMIRTL
jgi:flagellar hook-associated protein 1 FlgK